MKKANATLLGCGIMVIGALILWVGGMALIAIPATWAWNQLVPSNRTTWLVMWVILLVVTFIGNFIIQGARK